MTIEQKSGLTMIGEKPMIYEPTKLPGAYPLDPSNIYGFTGGKFDHLHRGHRAYLELIQRVLHGLARHKFPNLNDEEVRKRSKLFVGVVRPGQNTDSSRSSIFPHWLRLTQVLEEPEVAAVYTATKSIYDDLAHFDISDPLRPPIIVFESLTTKDIHAPWRGEIRKKLKQKGITLVMLPRLTNDSTTEHLAQFLLGSNFSDEFRIQFRQPDEPSTVQEQHFSLFYAKDLCLTPDMATIHVAEKIASEITLCNREYLRALDLGSGSGVFFSVVLLNTKRKAFSHIHSVDNDSIALGISDFNTTRAALFAEKDPSILSFSQSSWFDEIRGTYDLIYANPPYLPTSVGLGEEFRMNPKEAVYTDNALVHYYRIIRHLPNHIHQGSRVIIRVPRDENKVRPIKALITNTFNMEHVSVEDIFFGNREGDFHYGDGRFLILRFN